jgi:oligopeptidase A
MHDNFCIQDVFNKIKKDIDIFPINCADRSVNSFSHIFSAGFAAGYYSYLFSEMLAKDTFSYFEENNLLCKQVGLKFLSTILEQTGIKNITDLFFDFRGRFPIINCSK